MNKPKTALTNLDKSEEINVTKLVLAAPASPERVRGKRSASAAPVRDAAKYTASASPSSYYVTLGSKSEIELNRKK